MDPTVSLGVGDGEAQVDARLCAARNGSNSSLGELLEGCRGYMLLVANRALGDDLRQKIGASDLVQETFLDAKRDFSNFRGNSEREFYGWLTQILVNRLRNAARHYRETQGRAIGRELPLEADLERAIVELTGGDETPSALIAAWEEEQRVRDSLERLSETDRQVLILRNWEDRSFAEIGEQMGRSAEAARKLWIRAVERLGRELEANP